LILRARFGNDADTIFPSPIPAGLGLDAVLNRGNILGARLVLRKRCRSGQCSDDSDNRQSHYGVSHFGACGGFTTRILVALSFLSSAISASESLKLKTSRFCFKCSGVAVRGIEQTPICTK